jgi:glutamine amidotransferase-like uncharacterized protein
MNRSALTFLLVSLAAVIGEAAETPKTLRIALYDGPGSAGKGVPRMTELLSNRPEFQLTLVPPADFSTVQHSRYDVVIFTGGSGSGQSKGIREEGLKTVQSFVQSGGGYVGICAGAYLACSGFSWGAKVLDAKTVSPKWRRGVANVKIQLTDEGRAILGSITSETDVKYANGPILTPFGDANLPDYRPLAIFTTEVSENETPVGVMKGSPAIAAGAFGKGRVIAISPHPEQTPGLDELVRNAVRWAGGRLPNK